MASRRRPPGLARAALAALAVAAAGCWDDPVRETVTIDLRERGRVGLAVAIELDSPRELEREPAPRRAVELAAADLLEGRHRWNDRFAQIDCAVESGGWRRERGELRRYTLEALCDDPGALAALLGDRQLVVELSWQGGAGELLLVPNGGDNASRADRQRLARELGHFAADVARYVDAARSVARLVERAPERAAAVWTAVLIEGDSHAASDGEPLLTAAERPPVQRLLDAMTDVLGVFTRAEGEPESLDAVARRVFDPLPRRVEVLPPPRHELEVVGFLPSSTGRFALPARGFEGALTALEGRWLEPDPALVLLRHLRSEGGDPPDLEPFLRGSIVRSEERIDGAQLRREVEATLAPASEYRLAWRPIPAAAR
jgi:hypothetical protein